MPLTPPQGYRKTRFTHRRDTRANQPAAADVLNGTLYYVTDEEVLERSNGAAWQAISIKTRYDNIQTTFTEAYSIHNDQAATGAITRQFSPALIFSGTAWNTGSSASKQNSAAIYQRTVSGAATSGYLALAFKNDTEIIYTDDIYIGRAIAGGNPDIRFRDGNLFFKNSARGIYFVANPLTDTAPSTHLISATTTGKISLTPLINGSEAYVDIEQNVSGSGALTGIVPCINLRSFDQSTATPQPGLRQRAIPGGTAAAGFGCRNWFQASSTTTSNQDVGTFDCVWEDATHATRTGKFNFYLVNSAAALALKFEMLASGVFYTSAATFMIGTRTAYNDGAAGSLGTLGNAPAAGDPTKWIPVDDNGTTRYIPAW